MAIKNVYVRQLLDENRIIIEYLYDARGFKDGAIVAVLDPARETFKVGVSRVHPIDSKFYKGRLQTLPIVDSLRSRFGDMSASLVHAMDTLYEQLSVETVDAAKDALGRLRDTFTYNYVPSTFGALDAILFSIEDAYKKEGCVFIPDFDRDVALSLAVRNSTKSNGEFVDHTKHDEFIYAAVGRVAKRASRRWKGVKFVGGYSDLFDVDWSEEA